MQPRGRGTWLARAGSKKPKSKSKAQSQGHAKNERERRSSVEPGETQGIRVPWPGERTAFEDSTPSAHAKVLPTRPYPPTDFSFFSFGGELFETRQVPSSERIALATTC